MEVLGVILGVIIFAVLMINGFSAIGDAYKGGGIGGVIVLVVIAVLIVGFGL